MIRFEAASVLMLVLLVSWPAVNIAMALLAWVPRRVPRRLDGPPRRYWIVIPARDEATVIRRTVDAALAWDSADAPVRVMVVDDASEDGTPDVLAAIDDPRLVVIRRERPHARQGKGEALNEAYRVIRDRALASGEADTTVIGVVDGDGRGGPGVVRDVVDHYFSHPEVGALQCRVRIHNRGPLLGLLQDIEFGCVANAAQSFRDLVDSVGMGGNGQFVRLPDLMRFGRSPWSNCLVDDLELGLRLHLAGVRVRYTPHAVIDQQAVVRVGPLLRQRARWAQGNLQCSRYVRSLARSREVGSIGLIDYLAYLVAPWLTAPFSILFLAVVAAVVSGLVTGSGFGGLVAVGDSVPYAVAVWAVMIFLPGLAWGLWHRLHLRDEPLSRCLAAGLCYPFFLMMGIVSTWLGLIRYALGRDDWAKTERVGEQPAGRATTVPGRASARQ
ncbi:MAG TPA: glycosyltransferase family 2 protein [Pseudonocardiaceae bacterium]